MKVLLLLLLLKFLLFSETYYVTLCDLLNLFMWSLISSFSKLPIYILIFQLSESVVQRCSVKKVFLEISQNSQENTCARVSFLIKLQVRPATLLKKRLWHRRFLVNFVKFLRRPSFIEHLWWLLLTYKSQVNYFRFFLRG